jgi:putative IMPACT (imprinted ancient) family translation regulator
MKLLKSSTIIIKKSKFIGYYYQVLNVSEVKAILNELKKEHKKCSHLPYAYKINNMVKKSDDKEPNGTAGTPILNIINIKNLDNALIIIIRYFGGIKLGASGLIRAYSNISNEVTKK